MPKTPIYLMTDESHFEVSYKINPWMTPDAWRKDEARNRMEARESWKALEHALKDASATVVVMEGAPGLPDMVFPANSAIVLNRRALVARFRYHERQGEERHFEAEFDRLKDVGLIDEVGHMPKGCWQEGAGDCIWDASRQIFWAGFGPRSSFEAIAEIKNFFELPMRTLELVSGRFYHLDTCFVPLSGGEILFYPPAFSKPALAAIREHVPAHALVEASEAVRLAPQSGVAHFYRGRILYDLGRTTEAQPEFETASQLVPQMPEPRYFLALVDKQEGKFPLAAGLLKETVKLQPRNATAWNLLGQSLERESQTQAAIAAWRQAVAIEPDNSQALWSLARAVKSSDPGEAARLMARYSRVQRQRHIVDEASTLGNEALVAGAAHDWPEAIRRFRKAIEVCGDCAIKADLHKKLGLTAWQTGDIDGGEKELRLAQALKPEDQDIDQALERIAATRTKGVASHPDSESSP